MRFEMLRNTAKMMCTVVATWKSTFEHHGFLMNSLDMTSETSFVLSRECALNFKLKLQNFLSHMTRNVCVEKFFRGKFGWTQCAVKFLFPHAYCRLNFIPLLVGSNYSSLGL